MDVRKLSRRQFLGVSGVATLGLLAGCEVGETSKPAATAEPTEFNADSALQMLKDGNARFVTNLTVDPNQDPNRRTTTAKGQNPFATIVGCVDSRVGPEVVFDRGIGDLFVVRTAGQVIDDVVIGSIEFGTAELGIPLVMVLGHQKCGAVTATIESVEKNEPAPDQIAAIVEHIRPAVEAVKASGQEPSDLVDAVVRENTKLTVAALKAAPLLAQMESEGKVRIIGGYYHLDSGTVEFF
ncbi:carbonic anhydrase [Herpetosiphon gulosus]|uniref:Carbonic anhydrase n=1 Tax=Herpetosiphon gulosus TaxID=1973496 RepID=A0ABP9X4L6_9CHLR